MSAVTSPKAFDATVICKGAWKSAEVQAVCTWVMLENPMR